MKPLVEKKAEALRALIAGLRWHKGYCPICGSMPELSFIKGEEGQRWLRCALCSHSWRFLRPSCPFCENEDQEQHSIYYIDGRKAGVGRGLRKMRSLRGGHRLGRKFDEPVLEVAVIGWCTWMCSFRRKDFFPRPSVPGTLSGKRRHLLFPDDLVTGIQFLKISGE